MQVAVGGVTLPALPEVQVEVRGGPPHDRPGDAVGSGLEVGNSLLPPSGGHTANLWPLYVTFGHFCRLLAAFLLLFLTVFDHCC